MTTTEAVFSEHAHHAMASRKLWQWDYGQRLIIKGVTLPEEYEVHFCNAGDRDTTIMRGGATGVMIPDKYLKTGKNIFAYVYLHDDEETDGETVYVTTINVRGRPKPDSEGEGGGGGSAVLVGLEATANGRYLPSEYNADGFSDVSVDVPPVEPVVKSLAVTENGTYTASDENVDGFDVVEVEVENTYVAGDEGKVVHNSALVSQTSTVIRDNGTYDTTMYNSVEIDVESEGGDDLRSAIDGTITLLSNSEATSVHPYAFYGCYSLISINLPAATTIGNYAFANCSPSYLLVSQRRPRSCTARLHIALPSHQSAYRQLRRLWELRFTAVIIWSVFI